jgi:transcriptional regulator with XRE-family HTH domain
MLSAAPLGNDGMKSKGGLVVKRGQTHPAIETIKERVEERRTAANLSRNEASRRAGLGLSYINDLMSDKSKNPGHEGLVKLAALLDTDVDYFYGKQPFPRKEGYITSRPAIATIADDNGAILASLPLYQIGLTDPDGFFSLPESRRTPWPMPVANSDVYCVTVPDDMMAPRFRVGEVVIVNPSKPVLHGGFAVVRMADERVAIREVVKIASDMICVRSLNDQAIQEIPRANIKSLDRIVGSCELA